MVSFADSSSEREIVSDAQVFLNALELPRDSRSLTLNKILVYQRVPKYNRVFYIMARVTVEDCLRKEENRFSLVLLASRRAKELIAGSTSLVKTKGNKAVVSALREIASGKVRFKKES